MTTATERFPSGRDSVEAEVAADGGIIISNSVKHESDVAVETRARPPPVDTNNEGTEETHQAEALSFRADIKSQASLVVLQKELHVLDTLVDLQVRKLQTLEKMRASLIDASDTVASPEERLTGSRRHRTQQATRQELQEAVERKLEFVTAQVVAEASSSQFDSFFIEKALVELNDEVVDVKMGKIKTLPTHDLIAVGSRGGQVELLVSTGRKMLSIDTEMPLVGVQLETTSDPPLLAILSHTPNSRLRVFALGIQLDIHNSPSDDPDASQAKRPVAVDAVVAHEIPLSLEHAASSSAISAITIARSTRRSLLSVARTDGTMGFYALNGTLVHEVTTHASRVETITTHRNLVAFANGSSIAVFPLTKQKEPEYQICHGSRAAIISIAFDPVTPDVVYAGTSEGELLAFLLSGNAETPRQCKLRHRAVVTRSQPVHIEALKGYVAAVSHRDLVLFNVTRGEGTVRLERACATTTDLSGSNFINERIAVAENGHSTVISVVRSGPGVSSLVVLQSLLPSGEGFAGEPNLWRGATIMAMIAIVVLTAQFFLRHQKEPHGFGTMSDADKWRDILDRHRESSVKKSSAPRGAGANSMGAMDDTYTGDPTMYNATPDMFGPSTTRPKRGDMMHNVDEDQLRRKITEARRGTLECSLNDDDDE